MASSSADTAAVDSIPIEILTDDALLLIFSFLTVWDKGRVACVCKKWWQLICTSSLWKEIVAYSSGRLTVSRVEGLIDTYADINTTRIYAHWANMNILDQINTRCPKLQDLEMAFAEEDNVESLTFGNELKSLALYSPSMDGLDPKHTLCDIKSISGDGFHDLNIFTAQNFNVQLSNLSIQQLGFSQVLHTIHLISCNVSNDFIDMVEKSASTLTQLVLQSCMFESQLSLASLIHDCGQACKNLESFYFSSPLASYYGTSDDEHTFAEEAFQILISSNKNMRHLQVHLPQISIDLIRTVASSLLQDLTLQDCYYADEILNEIGWSLVKLKSLTLSFTLYESLVFDGKNVETEFTNRGLEGLSQNQSIETLRIFPVSDKITCTGIVRAALSMAKLTKLVISHCNAEYKYDKNMHTYDSLDKRIKKFRSDVEVYVDIHTDAEEISAIRLY